MIETKVTASTASAAASGIILWALSTYLFKGNDVPAGVVSLVYLLVPGVLAAVAGYLAPHTHRPDLAPAPSQAPDLPSFPAPPPLPPTA